MSNNSVSVERYVVRKRNFPVRDIEGAKELLDRLSRENHTGVVSFNLSQGGVNGCNAEDRAKLAAYETGQGVDTAG